MADANTFSQSGQYISISTPLGTDKLILREISGEERLSSLFLYRLTLLCADETVDFSKLIGQAATVTIKVGASGTARYINGIITRFVFTHFDSREKTAYYEAELRPWLWLLTLSGDTQIFQQKSVTDIVQAVCKTAGWTALKLSLTGTYAAEDYRVQYGETDYNFVARLLEEKGIFYYFTHTSSAHTLVLGDDASAFVTDSIVAKLTYWPEKAYTTEDESVDSIRYEQTVATKTIGVNSYNFQAPATALYATSAGTKGAGTFSVYSGTYIASADGEAMAKVMQQAATTPTEMILGSGKLRSLAAGNKNTLAGHPRSALNQEYVLMSVRVEASRTSYLASFEAFPSKTPFKPSGTATKPRIASSTTATVVGKSGEEIWTDSFGRVKVQFPWDRVGKNDENSSCWIRVAHNWAGKTFGIIFIPRIGQEVVVSFMEGDPDRPLITGSVYNGTQTVPYALPDNSTRSTIKTQTSKNGTGKFNELRFEDKADNEEVFFQAQKDLNATILNNATYTITNDYAQTINHDSTQTIKNNRAHTVTDGNETREVTKGTLDETYGGAHTMTDKDAFTHKVTKDYSLTIDGNLTITVTGDVVFKGKSLDFESTSAAVTLKSAAAATVQSGAAMTVKSGAAMTVDSGAALDIKSQMAMSATSQMGLNLKASLALQAQGLSSTVKGDASAEISTGGMLTVKGSMTNIN